MLFSFAHVLGGGWRALTQDEFACVHPVVSAAILAALAQVMGAAAIPRGGTQPVSS